MKHLLDVDELSWAETERILGRAAIQRRTLAAAPAGQPAEPVAVGPATAWAAAAMAPLAGRRVGLLFAEPSTRTRLSFEIAARQLGAETFVIDPGHSSLVKGETLADTVRTLGALGLHALVMRHHRAGAPWVAARYFNGAVVNAGDGWHAHPTQALLDLFTLRRALAARDGLADGTADGSGRLAGRKVAIVGDLLHSRVARSNAWTLVADGAELRVCGPRPWLRGWDELAAELAVKLPSGRLIVTDDLSAAIGGADAVMALRVQKERMRGGLSLAEYVARYQVTDERLSAARPGCLFMHPGPVNEGIEVTHALAVGPRSLVLEQVASGVPVRMAVLEALLGGDEPTGRSIGTERAAEGLAPGSAPVVDQSTRDLSSVSR